MCVLVCVRVRIVYSCDLYQAAVSDVCVALLRQDPPRGAFKGHFTLPAL